MGTKRMKLTRSVKSAKKVTRKARGGAKRKFGEIDTTLHSTFQPLIDAIGSENILESFASMLGREGLVSYGVSDDSMGIASRIRKSTKSIPDDFSGIIYDGAHWKGYEVTQPDGSRIVYDSYASDLQLPGSNNFCQSYATFLWARKEDLSFKGIDGSDIDIHFIPGDYTGNVKQMASFWLAWIETMSSSNDERKWLTKAIPAPFNIKMLKETMEKLSLNDKEASAFATSS